MNNNGGTALSINTINGGGGITYTICNNNMQYCYECCCWYNPWYNSHHHCCHCHCCGCHKCYQPVIVSQIVWTPVIQEKPTNIFEKLGMKKLKGEK